MTTGRTPPNELAVHNMVDSWQVGAIASLGDNDYLSKAEFDRAVGKYYHNSLGGGKTINTEIHRRSGQPPVLEFLSLGAAAGAARVTLQGS